MGAWRRREGHAPHARHGSRHSPATRPRPVDEMWRVVVPRGGDQPPPPPPPEHWGYAPPWAPPPPVAPQPPHRPAATAASKRPLSDSEDGDDVFSESSKDQCASPGDPDSCQMMSRKKRRGVIEKRRRDRINTSLCELRRLVPSAFEKQGSAKLEKAEILQMTVDHLKMLHAKGLDALAYDPSKFAMDYHNIGFRECAAEVARYLVTVEGLDIQDPLRLRLMSHLQCFAAQRELAAKPAWPAAQPAYPDSGISGTGSSANSSFESVESAPPASSSSAPSSSASALTPLTTVTAPYHHQYHHQSHAQHYPQQHYQGTHQPAFTAVHHQDNGHPVSSQMKPYRPWGAEVAY